MSAVIRVVVGALLVGALSAACIADRYIIGTYGAGGNGGGGGGTGPDGGAPGGATGSACNAANGCRFAAELDRSGAGNLADTLVLPSATLTATLRYRGEQAEPDAWPADRGPLLTRAGGAPQVGLEAPFTDATGAVALDTVAASYAAGTADPGAVASDDFVLEVVLRAGPEAPVLSKGSAGSFWSLASLNTGALALELADGARTVRVLSEPLEARAWYHCLFWVSRAAGGRADCNGRVGSLADVGALGALGAAGNLTVGGSATGTAPIQLAVVQFFRAPPGELGAAATWDAVSRRRFAELTGVYPRLANGTPLPVADLRDSVAYLDMQRVAGGARRLFLVGPDWPRVVCRTDIAGTRDCGYFSEHERGRVVDPSPAAWTASEVGVSTGDVPFVDGDQRMAALVPSAASVQHALSRRAAAGSVRQAFSFYARAGVGRLVGASVAAVGLAVFDLDAGTVVSAPAAVTATIEPWGNGVYRCGYIFAPPGGSIDYRVVLLNDSGEEIFAGDGVTIWTHIAGLQLDVNQPYPSALIADGPQRADRLTYAGDDGNLPRAGASTLGVRVLLPTTPRLNDQAVLNLNKGGANTPEINLFVVANTGAFQFWGRSPATDWSLSHPIKAVNGVRHTLTAEWGGNPARLLVDGVVRTTTARAGAALFETDRIDVGFSLHSSTHLQGLAAGVFVRGPAAGP